MTDVVLVVGEEITWPAMDIVQRIVKQLAMVTGICSVRYCPLAGVDISSLFLPATAVLDLQLGQFSARVDCAKLYRHKSVAAKSLLALRTVHPFLTAADYQLLVDRSLHYDTVLGRYIVSAFVGTSRREVSVLLDSVGSMRDHDFQKRQVAFADLPAIKWSSLDDRTVRSSLNMLLRNF